MEYGDDIISWPLNPTTEDCYVKRVVDVHFLDVLVILYHGLSQLDLNAFYVILYLCFELVRASEYVV